MSVASDYRFVASTGHDGTGLRLSTRCALAEHLVQLRLDAVVVLAALEPLCARLEHLLEHPLDFKPVTRSGGGRITANAASFSFDTAVDCIDLPDVDTGSLPVTVELPPLSGGNSLSMLQKLSGLNACWSDTPVTLELDRVSLSAADQAALEPGSLLLLPASFSSHWHCRLLLTDHSASMAVTLDAAAAGLQGSTGAGLETMIDARGDDVLDGVSVEWAPTLYLAPPLLLDGLQEKLALDWHRQPGHCNCTTSSGDTYPGSLIPVAGGYGVLLDEASPREAIS